MTTRKHAGQVTGSSNFKKLEGLIAAPHTPFGKDGEINIKEIPRQVALLVRSGVKGAYICGSTGEGISCSVAERKAVAEAWVKHGKDRLFLIVHVGALALKDAQELAAHAQRIGGDATSIVPPSFFKPASIDTLIDYINAVVSHAPELPFYYYHTGMSGVSLPMVQFLEKADGRIPNLAGIKFNSPDLYEYQNCLRSCGGKYDITWGVDEFLAGAIACGAKSAIGSTYNYSAPLYHKIWTAVEKGDLKSAQAGMTKVCQIVDILVQYGGIAAGKAMMAIHGIDVGDVRLPLKALTSEQKKDIVSRLNKILKDMDK
jgi:N-acetylneuraminate lyase